MKSKCTISALFLVVGFGCATEAETLRWARAGDALTLDPHAQNEGPTHTIRHQIYEPLIVRDMTGAFEAALATEWKVSKENPNAWIFTLRESVTFHNGADFTAEDVVFSLERARHKNSDMKELVSTIVRVEARAPHVVEIVTDGPNPILPSNMTNLMIMDKDWTEANETVDVQDYEGGGVNFATTYANGTGAYVLVSREPDVKTVMVRNENYWGRHDFPMDVREIVYTPIQNPATRVAALLSGEINFLQDVPVQDIDRVGDTEGIVVKHAPANRVIFFGLNQGSADIDSDNVADANPLADLRVRQAMSMAINREAIQQIVMRGQSQPAGLIAPPFVNGWTEDLDAMVTTDIGAAKALMAEAGYGEGFSLRLDCPKDRYINDEAICQAAVGMLAQIGVEVTLDAKPKAQHFPKVRSAETDFYMLGWGAATYDSEDIFNFLVHGKDDTFGSWNLTGFNNADLNEKIRSLASNVDLDARNKDIADIWRVVQEAQVYIPIHYQVLNWAMSDKIGIEVDPEDQPKVKYMTMH